MSVNRPRKKPRIRMKDPTPVAPLSIRVSRPKKPNPKLDGASPTPRRLDGCARGGTLSLALSILLLVAVVVAVIILRPGAASPYGSHILPSNQHGSTPTRISPTSSPSPTALPTLPARPTISQYAVLFAVDTAGPDVAWAAGRTLDASGQQISLLARYSGGTWTQDNSPGAMIPHTELFGIAMVNVTDGWAVGGTFDVPPFTSIILHYTAGRWTRIAGPPNATLRALSMDAPNDGWAAGQTDDATNAQALFLHYDGTRWNEVPTTLHANIAAIDMLAANDGWAAGDTGQGMLILHYDGTRWTPVPTPFDHTPTAELSGISLANDNTGWAVGADYGSNSRRTVLLSYQDGRWQEVASPLPTAYLSEVRMLAPDDAWAVGDTTDPTSHSVLLHFHNGFWQPLASPANATLRAIAFSSVNTGWAVGGLPNGGLILHDAGGIWSSAGG